MSSEDGWRCVLKLINKRSWHNLNEVRPTFFRENIYGWIGTPLWAVGTVCTVLCKEPFFKVLFQLLRLFPAIFSILRVVWPQCFYWRIALTLRNVFHIQNMILNSFPIAGNRRKSWKKNFKNVPELIFGSVQKPLVDTFRRKFCFKWPWEMNLETCSGYEKHSSESGKYISKKIRVIRRVEVKTLQEIDEKVEKNP